MSEQLYDEVIAPKLLELGKLSEENGMSLVVYCEYAPGAFGSTLQIAKGAGFAIRLVEAAMQARGNVDALYFALQRYAKKHGHNSLVLSLLGSPKD